MEEDVTWQIEGVANSAALAVKINWNVKMSGVSFYLTFS